MMYIILGMFGLLFIFYLYFQVKIKNNKNYPAVYALKLAFLILFTNYPAHWIIKNINIYLELSLEIPKQLSLFDIGIFFLLLYGITALYYQYTFGHITQKNSIFSFFQNGNNEQSNRKR